MRIFVPFLAAAILALSAPAQQFDPSTLPAKDQHQKFLVAAEVYSDAARVKAQFGKDDPLKAGVLPVEVYFRNSTSDPVRVNLSTIRLDVDAPDGQRYHLESLSLERAAQLISHPKGPSAPTMSRFPANIPILNRDNKTKNMEKKLQPMVFQTDVVPPGATIHGFVFFNMNHDFDMIPDSTLYVPDVKSVASNEGLIYFEVPLRPSKAN